MSAQAMTALKHGNARRIRRAELRRDVKAGRANLVRVLELTPPEVENMAVGDILVWQPWVGRWTARRLLARLGISEHRRVCELTERQLGCLAAAVEQWRLRGAA